MRDEDIFEFPAGWLGSVHPRRGGVACPPPDIKGDPGKAVRALVESISTQLVEIIADDRSDARLVSAVRGYLEGDGNLAGAAATAAMAASFVDKPGRKKLALFADDWVARHGVVEAARAATEMAGVTVASEYFGPRDRKGQFLRQVRPDENSGWYLPWHGALRRVRAHLAVAPEAEYRRAVEALAGYRDQSQRQRVVARYLVPTERAWVDDLCTTDLAGAPENLALLSVGTWEQLDAVAGRVFGWTAFDDMDVLATLADAVGPAMAPAVHHWLHEVDPADAQRRLLGVLAVLPTDEAFTVLLKHLNRPYVGPALIEAMDRYPRRALRLLAAEANGESPVPEPTKEMLRRHAAAHPELAAAELPSLGEATRKLVEASISRAAQAYPPAPPAALPPVLVDPPWTRQRGRTKAAVVAGLRPSVPASLVWLPGEREAWLASKDEARGGYDVASIDPVGSSWCAAFACRSLTALTVSGSFRFVATYHRHEGWEALGDPSRFAIVQCLAERPRAVGELAEQLPISRPAVSQHLKVLKAAGLVTDHAVGTRRVYRLNPAGVAALRDQLDVFWNRALTGYQDVVEQPTEENS